MLKQAWCKHNLHDQPYADGSKALEVVRRWCRTDLRPFHELVREAFSNPHVLSRRDGVHLQVIAARAQHAVSDAIPADLHSFLRGLVFIGSLIAHPHL